MNDSSQLQARFGDYANGRISAEQLQELEAALASNHELRRDFIEYMNLDSALGDLAALAEGDAVLMPASGTATRFTVTPRAAQPRTLRFAGVMGAVAASLLIVLVLWTSPPHDNVAAPSARLVTAVNAQLQRDGKQWTGSDLPEGSYDLGRGLIYLQFTGGVAVYLEGPASFEIVSKKLLKLRSGRLSANVPPAGIGFTVETSEATVVDYGTEFSVEAGSGASEVHVFSGLVRVQSRSTESDQSSAVELQTAEAVRIDDAVAVPVPIELDSERFIRSFDEPKRKYANLMRKLQPVVFYRMPIRRFGPVAEPQQYSGEVLTGEGAYVPHAKGAFSGSSLRVMAGSMGRGGRVDRPPPFTTGDFTMTTILYLESRPPDGVVATNINDEQGAFALSLDEQGRLRATVRLDNGRLQSLVYETPLPLATWCQVVMVADGQTLQLYVDNRMVASQPCGAVATSGSETLWFGTEADSTGLWDGRIDELAMFDRALTADEIAALHRAAMEEMEASH